MIVSSNDVDCLVAQLDSGVLSARAHAVVRSLYERIANPSKQQKDFIDALDHDLEFSQSEWAARLWEEIEALAPNNQGSLRMMIPLIQEDTALTGYEAEYLIEWAREQGVSDDQIIASFRG